MSARLTEDDYDACVKSAVREAYPEWPQRLGVANAVYQLGIERGKIEREKYNSFICNKCGLRQDSKPSGESPF